MLHEYVLPVLAVHFRDHFENGLFRDLWWAQDGAPVHRLLEVRDRLNGVFGNDRVIGLGYNVEWPPRSPALIYTFLWGYLKGKVLSSPPHDVNILRQRIIAEFNALRNNPNLITNAVRHMQNRTTLCVQRNGGQSKSHNSFQNILSLSLTGVSSKNCKLSVHNRLPGVFQCLFLYNRSTRRKT